MWGWKGDCFMLDGLDWAFSGPKGPAVISPVQDQLPTGPIRGSDPNTDCVCLYLPGNQVVWLSPEAARVTGLRLIQEADKLQVSNQEFLRRNLNSFYFEDEP